MSAASIINSRKALPHVQGSTESREAEGGCGVVGFACDCPLEGKYLLQSLVQMRNRGNGKGGGIAALGLVPKQMGVSEEVLRNDYILQIAYLDSEVQKKVEDEFVRPYFDVHHETRVWSI